MADSTQDAAHWAQRGVVPGWVTAPDSGGLVRRRRAEARLQRGLRVTTLVAPAGFGKTSAIAAWIPHARTPCAWLGIRRSLDDPDAFLRHLVAAWTRAAGPPAAWPASGVDVGVWMMDHLVLPQFAAEAQPLTVVLDGTQHLSSPALWAALRDATDASPPALRWVLASRSPIELPLARFTTAGEHTTIGTELLSFDADEIAAFCATRSLPPRTDGSWPAGLALGLRAPEQAHAFVSQEIVAELPPDLLAFVDAIAPLQPVEPAVCDALHPQAPRHLRALRDRGLLVGEQLFAPLAEARSTPAARGRAATVLLGLGRFDEAAEQLQGATPPEGWAQALSAHGWTLIRMQRLQLLATLLAPVADDGPLWRVWRAWSLRNAAPEALDAAIAHARELALPDPLLRSLQCLDALSAVGRGDPAAGIAAANAALSGLDDTQRGLAVALRLAQAVAHELLCAWEPAEAATSDALHRAVAEPPLPSVRFAWSCRVRQLRRRGQLNEAERALHHAGGTARIDAGLLAFARGELQAAEAVLTTALSSAEVRESVAGWIALVAVRRACGDDAGAADALLAAEGAALGSPWQAALVRAHADPFAALPELSRIGDPMAALVRPEQALLQADAALAGDEDEPATLRTEHARALADGRGWDAARLGIRSVVFVARTDPTTATQQLARVVGPMQPEGFVQPVRAHAEALRPLVTRLPAPLARWMREASGDPAPSGADGLTPREVDVMHLAARGLSNRAMAAHLQVSLGTVKTHMHHALTKLGASNRTEAVHLARQRGLLGG